MKEASTCKLRLPPKALSGGVLPPGTVGLWVLKSFSTESYDVLGVLNKLIHFRPNSMGGFVFPSRGGALK